MKTNKENYRNQITEGVDERVKFENDSALATVGRASVFCVIVSLIYRLYADQNPAPELISVVIMLIVYTVVNRRNHVYDMPISFTGKALETGLDKKSKQSRMKYYILDSVCFAAMYTVIDTLVESKVVVSSVVIDIIVAFFVSLVINYLTSEHNIKKYNEYLGSLENDEDDEEDE